MHKTCRNVFKKRYTYFHYIKCHKGMQTLKNGNIASSILYSMYLFPLFRACFLERMNSPLALSEVKAFSNIESYFRPVNKIAAVGFY